MPFLYWLAAMPAAAFVASMVSVSTDLEPLARQHAPVLRQDTVSDQDFITSFDFDGDWNGSNNWENQPKYPPRAVVYWAGVETETHTYLLYAWFHPRDYSRWQTYGRFIGKTGAHENDLEGVLLVLENNGAHHVAVVAETVFHSRLLKYSLDARYHTRPGVGGDGSVPFEAGRIVLQIESRGHGVEAWDREEFPGGDGVVYRVGNAAGVPSGLDDRDVTYQLVDIESTLWARRFDVGDGLTYERADQFGRERFGHLFESDNFDEHKAKAPWGWDDEDTALPKGTIFFDPARLVRAHFAGPMEFLSLYRSNPFTDVVEVD